jgi:hypothetical protein
MNCPILTISLWIMNCILLSYPERFGELPGEEESDRSLLAAKSDRRQQLKH